MIKISKELKNFVGQILNPLWYINVNQTLVSLVEYDNILKTPKFEDDPKVKMEDICNKDSKFSTLCYAEPHLKTVELSILFKNREIFLI